MEPTRPVGSQQCFEDTNLLPKLSWKPEGMCNRIGDTVSSSMSTSSRTVGMMFNSENCMLNTYQTGSTPELIICHGGTSKNPSQMIRHFPHPSRESHPPLALVIQNHLTLAAWGFSQTSGLSEDAQRIHWTFGEEAQQSQHGEYGSAGVMKGTLIPFEEYLTKLCQEGKEHSTINTNRSMLSVALPPSDGSVIGNIC